MTIIIVIMIDLLHSVQLVEGDGEGSDGVVDERRRCVQVPIWHLAHTHLLQDDFVVVVNFYCCKNVVSVIVVSKLPIGTSHIAIYCNILGIRGLKLKK